MWELDCEEGWVLKNWCFWTVVLEKTLESPLDCKEMQPVHSEGDQPWDFFGRNDAKAETPVLWPPHAKSWLIGKDWCWEGLGAGGKGDDRGWDGWMASLTHWTWVWVNSGVCWWTGRPGVLRFMGSKRSGHDWATELNWTELNRLSSSRCHLRLKVSYRGLITCRFTFLGGKEQFIGGAKHTYVMWCLSHQQRHIMSGCLTFSDIKINQKFRYYQFYFSLKSSMVLVGIHECYLNPLFQ